MSGDVHQSNRDCQDQTTGCRGNGRDREAGGVAGHEGTRIHGTVQGINVWVTDSVPKEGPWLACIYYFELKLRGRPTLQLSFQ